MTKSDMLSGLTNKSPSAEDKSTQLPKGPGVNSESTRKDIAPNQPTIGPRCA